MAPHPLIGTWRLVSLQHRRADGTITYPLGREHPGYIIYTPEGRMMMAAASANRPALSSRDRYGGEVEEKASAYDSYMSYSGGYEIQGNRVIHHVEISLYPNRVGTDLVRFFELDGDRLTLTTPPILGHGSLETGHVVRERVI